MSDSSHIPETPKQRRYTEYEDPHYHDEDEAVPIEDDEPHRVRKPAPRRQPLYRPRRRFEED